MKFIGKNRVVNAGQHSIRPRPDSVTTLDRHFRKLVEDLESGCVFDQVFAPFENVYAAKRFIRRHARTGGFQVIAQARISIADVVELDENLKIVPVRELLEILEIALPLVVSLGQRSDGAIEEGWKR